MTTTFPRTMGYGLGSTSFQRGASAFGPWVTADPYDYPLRDQTMTTAPTFPPFKFEPRRSRIDWRLLHGIDINALVRDVDLDTLEKIVNIVAFGDIEAEDTRHLTELNFIKIFRLSQMMIEYLLYVQDCLQSSNTWLQQDRSNMDKYVQAARLRIRELEANLKMNKRELRRTRKTVKTYELLAVLNDGKSTKATSPAPAATATVAPSSPPPPPQPTQVVKMEPNPVNVAMEALLRKELAVLSERLSKATLECQTLRVERDDLFQAVKDLETAVKSRPQQSEGPSLQGYTRPSAEAMQTIQSLQDQLTKATVEITKLRNEKSELLEELEQANSDRRQLQDEKGRLLSEIASRLETPKGVAGSSPSGENLGVMLLEAERQKEALQEELAASRAEVAQLQKQLVKAFKDTAFGGPMGGMPQSQAAEERLRELEAAVRELEGVKGHLERDLADAKRVYNEDVRQLQEDLEMMQERAAAADRRLAELRTASGGSPTRAGGRMDAAPSGIDFEEMERQRGLLADYEAMNDRLNQQLMQLKDERNMLAGEVEQLRNQVQGRSPRPQGDATIGRDWRIEEMERLKDENNAAHRRVLDLEDALRDRDALVDRLRDTIRDLQAQLDEHNRQLGDAEAVQSRVKQQVQHFERMAGSNPSIKTQSFSFVANDVLPPSSSIAETPTSARKSSISERPQRPQSPMIEEETEPPVHAPPSPRLPEKLLDPSQGSRWLRRVPRPSPPETSMIQQTIMRRVGGLNPEQLEMMLQEEIRVITENPYPFEGEEEAVFHSILPFEMPERPGVRSVKPHNIQDLEAAHTVLRDQLLAVVDDELAQYGVDLGSERLTDKAYVACMKELSERRSQALARYPKEIQDRASELREFLLTHLELAKRSHQMLLAKAQQQQLQERLAATSTDGRTSGAPSGVQPGASRVQSGTVSPVPLPPMPKSHDSAAGATTTGTQSFSSAAVAAKKPLSVTESIPSQSGPSQVAPSQSAPSQSAPSQSAAHAFMPRQQSLERSSAGVSDAGMERLQGMLPPAPQVVRPAPEVVRITPAQRGQSMQDAPTRTGSTRISPVGSVKDFNSSATGRTAQEQVEDFQQSLSGSSESEHSGLRQQSLPRSATSGRQPAASAGASQAHSPLLPSREDSQAGAPVVMGHAKPAQMVRPAAQQQMAQGAAATPGGNMNMSIRSVKYQESEFDDDDDEHVPLAQPKPVRRVMDDDEYALTEDEEAQHDMGIEGSEDFSPQGPQPKILMRHSGPSSPPRVQAPSRLGPTAKPAVTQSRGWATDEPLQPAPAKPAPVQQQPETAELEELESIHSFDNSNSQSLRRPGAWGSPAGTMRKPAVVARETREPSTQLSRASKQSAGWNETIKSFGAPSATQEHEVHSIQEITGFDSFTDSVRAARPTPRGPIGASQATGGGPAPRPVTARRSSFDSELSDIEYA